MPYPKTKGFQELLERTGFCIENELPFVLYRKPLEKNIKAVFQSDASLNQIKDFTENGFVFAPFHFDDNAMFIRKDEAYIAAFEYVEIQNNRTVDLSDDQKENHIKLVNRGIEEIKKGNLQKVVLSRSIAASTTKNHKEIFNDILKSYTNALCYLFFHPKIGTWCGATPETLIKIKGLELSTVSLAATLPNIDGVAPKWKSKEVEEQKMVTDYIRDKLSNKVANLTIGNAASIKAGNLWHLKSKIKGQISNQTHIKEIITALHPTPAVCGIPTDSARAFIDKHENYKRTFYTGFLGELNLWNDREVSLYVNLRCMELKENKALVFVGGGITLASDPEREWMEIQNKSRTMLNML